MQEIRRVLFTKRRVLLLIILVLYSVFTFFKPLMNENAFWIKDEMEPYVEKYKDVPLQEAYDELYAMTDYGANYMGLERGGRLLMGKLEYLLEYPNFLANIQKQAGTMLTVSIFKTNDKSILKTAADYKQMEGIPLTVGMDSSVTNFIYRETNDYLLAAYMMVIAFSFMAERKRGLWNLICASAGGRTKLPVARLISLAMAAFMGAVLFTSVEAISGWVLYGGFDEMGRYIQSIREFQGLAIPMTIGQFWLFYTFLRFIGAFLVGLVFWIFFELIPDRRLAAIAFALFAGLEYVLFNILPGDYMLNTINLFMYISPKNLFLSYEVLTPFDLALGRFDVFLIFAAIAVVIGMAVILICAGFRKPTGGIAWVTRLTDFLRRHTAAIGFHGRLFFHELYKMMVTGRGAILIIVTLLIAYNIAESPYLAVDSKVSQSLETYYRQSQGELSEEQEVYLQTQREKLDTLKEEYAQLQEQYMNGEIDATEFRIQSLQYGDLSEKETALNQYEKDLAYLATVDGAYMMPHWVYSELFGVESDTVTTLQFINFVSVALICVLYASTEASTGMTKARRATVRGRSGALIARYGAGCVISALISILIWVLQLLLLKESYGELPFLQAPVCCLTYFRDVSQSVTIIGYWVITTIGRTLAMCAMSIALLWATDRLQK